METRIARLLHAKGKRLGLPIGGTFELTPRCNFSCKMCYVHLTQEEQRKCGTELTTDQWLALGAEAKRAGTVFLLLTGGEPTLRPDFLEIFRKLKAMGMVLTLNSNGLLLEGELLKALCVDPPSRINISLYGISNETYERQCGVPAYERIVANIRRLREAGLDVKISISVTPDNQTDFQAVLDKAKELGAHVQSTPYMFPPIRLHPEQYGKNFRLDAEEAGRMMAEKELKNSSPEHIRALFAALENGGSLLPTERDADCMDVEGDTVHCRGGVTTFWIDWMGRMLPCGQMVEPAADVQKLGFTQAWQTIRAATAAIRLPAACTVCDLKGLCHACAAMCYCESGSFEKKPEYVCTMRKAYAACLHRAKQEHDGGKR